MRDRRKEQDGEIEKFLSFQLEAVESVRKRSKMVKGNGRAGSLSRFIYLEQTNARIRESGESGCKAQRALERIIRLKQQKNSELGE